MPTAFKVCMGVWSVYTNEYHLVFNNQAVGLLKTFKQTSVLCSLSSIKGEKLLTTDMEAEWKFLLKVVLGDFSITSIDFSKFY